MAAQFASELDANPPAEVDETVKPSIDAIAQDLEKKYVFLDGACRDLNSQALSWEALAAEVLDSMTAPDVPVAGRRRKAPPPPPPLPSIASSQEMGESSGFLHHDVGELGAVPASEGQFSFRLSLEEIHQIMWQLGYKRLPSDLYRLSSRAEERIGRFLAVQAVLVYEEYFWSYNAGVFRAVGKI